MKLKNFTALLLITFTVFYGCKVISNQQRHDANVHGELIRLQKLIRAQYYVPTATKLEKFPALDSLDPQIYVQGQNSMKKHRAVIAGIARDNADDLAVMIRHIESLGDLFQDYRVIIFENDSTDGTKQILAAWQTRNANVAIITHDFNNKKRPTIQFLADARNYYLTAFKDNPEYQDFDILIPIDMDMSYGFDLRGLEHSFSQVATWGAVCSNGISNSKGEMYDMFAFRSAQFPQAPYNTRDYWKRVAPQGQLQVFKPGASLKPVYSCFGGLAIYKREFMAGCEYEAFKGDCEHVAFHECLLKNQAKMFLNPSQIIKYTHFNKKL